MLHMVVANHGPDTCAAVVPEVTEMAKAGFQQTDEAAKKLGITVQGTWTNMTAHTMYILVDAPNAHVVSQLFRDIHLMDWNTVVVNPVLTLQEAMGSLQQESASLTRTLLGSQGIPNFSTIVPFYL